MTPTPIHSASHEGKGPGALHMIHKWSIEHPYIIGAFYLAAIITSILSVLYVMPRRMMPYVESPLVGVVSMMPGLSAEEMEIYVSKPIEEQLVNIKGLRFIRSASQDGFSLVSLEFNYGQDMRKALFDVQALMNVVQANLPATGANLKPSWVVAIDPLNLPVLSLSLTGKGWDPAKLRELADNTVVNRLKTVPNVYSVVPFGGYRRQLQVLVDRDKLAGQGLSILSVRNAIDRFNVSRPAGTLTHGPSEAILRVDSRALSPSDVLNYPLTRVVPGAQAPSASGPAASGGEGMGGGMGGGASDAAAPSTRPSPAQPNVTPRVVYVRDVARVVDSFWERRSAYHYVRHDPGTSGSIEPSVEVSVLQNPEASSAQVVPAVMEQVRRIEQENPGTHFEVAYDNAHFVGILFHNMLEELGMAILLTGLALLFFLGEWRGTLIALITIPTSLALALLGMVPFGFTLNSGTLIGLLLSIGRLVDDSIIDIHAVERHLRMGKDAKTATIDGIAEVRLAVLASTLMLVLALSPLLVSGGITQLMFRELVWPIVFGLLASMLVSFTLTALLCANLLRPEAERAREQATWFYRGLLNPFQRALGRLEAWYGRVICGMLRNRFNNLARIGVTVILGFIFYHFLGSEMMPLADVGQGYGVLEMQPGTSFAETERAMAAVERIILKHPEVTKASVELGAETMFESFSPYFTGYQMPQVSAASLMLTLTDKDDRKRTIWDVMDAVQAEALATVPGIRRFQIKEMGSDVMATSAAPIHLLISGPDLRILDQLGQQTLELARKTKGIYQPATTWTLGLPEYRVKVDPQRAGELGLTAEDVSQQAYYSLRGGLASEFYRLPNLRQNTVLVRYDEPFRQTPGDIRQMSIATPDGGAVPLKSLASVQLQPAPTVIEHEGLRRVIGVTAFYRKGDAPSMDAAMALSMEAMSKLNIPPGYSIEFRGDMTQMMDSFRRLLIGLGVAMLFIYLVLVAQFRGLVQPLQMVASLPLELSGIFLALFLAHQAFSTVSIMAIVVLTGMDVTTAILLIDMIIKYREEGVPRDQAVAEACPQRLRPILMTSLITMLVMLPVALRPKTGMDAYQPLGTVIVGGLLVGTVLSLFDIPIMHTYVDDLVNGMARANPLRRRPESTPVEGETDA
ncbi:MAG TPA: efflux RND transporter permease subunit [Armatimonadota bacterium]